MISSPMNHSQIAIRLLKSSVDMGGEASRTHSVTSSTFSVALLMSRWSLMVCSSKSAGASRSRSGIGAVSSIEDEKTRESMRGGVMEFGSGCFRAIRNPVGHLPNDEVEMSEQEALERLAALSLLARFIDDAEIESA
ncbi:hypothetical protein F0402_15865 [Mycolicibacter arupensis]|nr:hypothetical protein F0402_15865 [Mycolicibacter arupensis]